VEELKLLYEDIVFSHQEYSPIIFDGMFELIEKVKSSVYKIEQYGIDTTYLGELKYHASHARHQMRVDDYIPLHNKLIEPFNQLIETVFHLPILKPYQYERYEGEIKDLIIHKVMKELSILKLLEQYTIMKISNHDRKDLRLQMFFENAMRYIVHADQHITFYTLINHTSNLETFLQTVMEGVSFSKTQIKAFGDDLKRLNTKRNHIKHSSDYTMTIDYERIEWYIPSIYQYFMAIIEKHNQTVFHNKQSLLEYHLAFRELSYHYKKETLNRMGSSLQIDDELLDLLGDDKAFIGFAINQLMERDAMDLIKDYEKMQSTLKTFHNMVNELEKLNEVYSDLQPKLEGLLLNLKDFSSIQEKLSSLDKLDLSKLKELIRFLDHFDSTQSLEQLFSKLEERLEFLKEGNELLKHNKKQLKALTQQVSKTIE
jgi:hypothetical protein